MGAAIDYPLSQTANPGTAAGQWLSMVREIDRWRNASDAWPIDEMPLVNQIGMAFYAASDSHGMWDESKVVDLIASIIENEGGWSHCDRHDDEPFLYPSSFTECPYHEGD